MTRKLKIFFHMMDGVGPQNACIGLGQVLQARGHQVCFLTKTDNRMQGKLSNYGFTIFPLSASEDKADITEEQAIAEQKDEVEQWKKGGMFENLTPLEKLKKMFGENNLFEEFMVAFEQQEMQLRAIIEREKPDLIVLDSVGATPPILKHAGIPWVSIYCSNPLGFYQSDQLPPPTSGEFTKND